MPKKYAKQKETPELFAKVFKVINGLKDKRNYITVHRIAKEIHAKLEQMDLKPDSRNVLMQVRRALKFGVRKKMFLYKAGKYRIAIEDSKSNSPKKQVVPLDSLEVLNSRKSQRRSRKSDMKKHRCTRQGHTSSCRKRYKKRDVRHNRRYLSRKCKSRYFLDSTTDKSSKRSSNSSTSPQLGNETTNAGNKSESEGFQKSRSLPVSSDIAHWDNKQEAIDKSKYGKQSRRSRVNLSPYHRSLSSSEGSNSRKNKKRKMKNLKEIENLSPDNSNNNLSTSTAIAAAIMIMMSLWYGCR